jgi:hypothetical protein
MQTSGVKIIHDYQIIWQAVSGEGWMVLTIEYSETSLTQASIKHVL